MSTLTKADAIKKVAEKTELKQYQVKAAIDALFYEVKVALFSGQRVEFRGFGSWEVRMGKARMGRNPSDPGSGPVPIPARPSLRFKLSKDLKAAVRSNTSILPP